ncbi:THUMP domain-containing class I SAM-dependent RNA methyltransferase [Porphyromonas gingivicanis]|uniref:THUMP domain-containing class I SAM-dependent RNA methyltransferase n=1 Tax=Porphyromonas gingivicanis TaxID=266762 RepID=UPI00068E749F|nr:THUMP domain-containing protein [Porphyromonas gingivicanis]
MEVEKNILSEADVTAEKSTDERFSLVAKTLAGLEEVLAQELRQLGARKVVVGRRMVSFEGNKELLYKANFHLRTALRILKPIYEFQCTHVEQLYDELSHFNWMRYLRVDQTFLIDPVVYSEFFTNSRYVSYRVKDAVADFFKQYHPEGLRPSVSTTSPHVRFNIHIAGRNVTLSIDSSGESLHKRGYKVRQTPAPINEVLAAGILLKAGWNGSCDLIDPMCGSGTFLIEAALIARNIAPATWRKSFAFEEWRDFDPILWRSIREDISQEIPFQHHIYGSDIASDAIAVAQSNIKHTGLFSDITLERISMEEREGPEQSSLVVINPPYGERLNRFDMERLYGMIGTQLKHKYTGSKVWIIAPRQSFYSAIALRHSSKEILFNGDIECELRSYDLFAGKREDFKRGVTNQKEPYKGKRDSRKEGEKPRFSDAKKERKPFEKRESKVPYPKREEGQSYQEETTMPRRRARIGERKSFEALPRTRFAQEERRRKGRAIQVFEEGDN